MRKPRTPETDEQRSVRSEHSARRKIDDDRAADDAVDQQIRRNIRLHGP
jgi:hypothetical protein